MEFTHFCCILHILQFISHLTILHKISYITKFPNIPPLLFPIISNLLITLQVDDCQKTYDYAMTHGGVSVCPVTELRDEFGSVLTATIRTFNDTVHSFVQRVDYQGPFLPGYKQHP